MPKTKPPISYTSRDYTSIRSDLMNYVKVYYPDTYKDFNEASFGSLMFDMVAYVGDILTEMGIKLRSDSESLVYELAQNKPNPFSGSTTVSFDLPKSTTATLSVMDVTGRIIWSYTDEFNKGTQSIIISERDINATGVLYYQLEAGDYTATKKMILLGK